MTTPGEEFEKLAESLRRAQEACANLSHLFGMQGDADKAQNWLTLSENFKIVQATTRMLYVTRTKP